jgi:cell division protein FtsQ
LSAISTEHISSQSRMLLDGRLRRVATRVSAARWPVALMGLIVVGAAAWWVTNSTIFDLRSLRIEGSAHLTRGQVIKAGKLTRGVNVLWTMPRTIERRLERHPWIKEAHVSRTLPSSLTVVIKERRPVAVFPRTKSLLSPDGEVLGKAKVLKHLPLIETATSALPLTRAHLEGEGVAVAKALRGELLPAVDRIDVGKDGNVELQLRGGTHVMWGDVSQLRAKAAVLRALLSWTTRNHTPALTLDVSVPGAPTLVPVDSTKVPA